MSEPDLEWIYELYLLAQKSSGHGDLRHGLDDLLRHIAMIFSAVGATLAEIDEGGKTLTIVGGIDLPDAAVGSTLPVASGIMGWVARHGEPLLLNGDLASDPRFRPQARKVKSAPKSALCWPLIVEEQTIGVISINRGASQPPFVMDDLRRGFAAIRFVSVAVENARLHVRSARYVRELRELLTRFEEAKSHLMQTEKMASLGQLAAGIAHEINNPISYIGSNLNALHDYVEDLLRILGAYESVEQSLAGEPGLHAAVEASRAGIDIPYLKADVRALIDESMEGVGRVRKIVQGLRDFSRVNRMEWEWADLHAGIDSTLNIVYNELKYKADIVKAYGELPLVQCMLSQLNQVFMNVLVNAAQAIDKRGVITIRTGTLGKDWVWVEVSDTGSGIAHENRWRIFEPFYTTKSVGKGTGLGLSVSYGIIEKHGGRIELESEPGHGSTFRISLPVSQTGALPAAHAGGRPA